MARLKDRLQGIPGGFYAEVPATGFKQILWSFEAAVKVLYNYLEGNPGIHARYPGLPKTLGECEAYVDNYNAERCLKIRGAESYVLKGVAPVPPVPKSPAPQRGPVAAERVGGGRRQMVPRLMGQISGAVTQGWDHLKNTVSGAQLVAGWLGSGGKTVSQDTAESRAAICAKCPKNGEGDFWQKLDAMAAEEVRRLVQMRSDMKLSTSRDSELKTCLACDCHLPLKVFVPMGRVLEVTSAATKSKLHPDCWMLKQE